MLRSSYLDAIEPVGALELDGLLIVYRIAFSEIA
jgi:hypothetical protein